MSLFLKNALKGVSIRDRVKTGFSVRPITAVSSTKIFISKEAKKCYGKIGSIRSFISMQTF